MTESQHRFNGDYEGEYLDKIAFPLGGIGAGMLCIEGAASISHVSIRHRPEMFNNPKLFAAIRINGDPNIARVLEGAVPAWKVFGAPETGSGCLPGAAGLPRFKNSRFQARFPFAMVDFCDPQVPLEVKITAWSPFTPPDADNSSLPVAAIEYHFSNPTDNAIEAVFSFHSENFLRGEDNRDSVYRTNNGFVLRRSGTEEEPWNEGHFHVSVDEDVKVDCAWFRGKWFDALTVLWKNISEGKAPERKPFTEGKPSEGASIYVPFTLDRGTDKTIRLRLCWYVPKTNLRCGHETKEDSEKGEAEKKLLPRYEPWYAQRFDGIDSVADYWKENYDNLRTQSQRFSDCFYDTTLPPEVIESVAVNLTILKSPTVLRQSDGRLWCWEGCCDEAGCCYGSCTHVWNYAQAIPHLFPTLERTLRQTEFNESQNEDGRQIFRSSLPIRPLTSKFISPAADGQLGGIMKVYRDWRISGDSDWLREIWKKVKQSLDYCIRTWDPDHKGALCEPHHNTYDIEFWGEDSMCSSFYLGALQAAMLIADAVGDKIPLYCELYEKGRAFLENSLFNGEYFYQKVHWEDLNAWDALESGTSPLFDDYSPEAMELLKQEGPKYQFGCGCLSDGVLGAWMAGVCGVGEILDADKVTSHLRSVHKYNLKRDLSAHPNPQRPGYAIGNEGGVLLCTWPNGGKPTLPFVYSDEVWTGIEYQVASHLIMTGNVEPGLEIVRIARSRYDGRLRNPFNEYECGHWYARAMSSYAMLGAISGARYDAVDKVLYLSPKIDGDFRAFLATASGYGTVGISGGKAFLEVKSGKIEVDRIKYEADM